MSLLKGKRLKEQLRSSYLVLDTNIFIHALKHPEVKDFLFEISESGCSIFTIPSVVFEVVRGSRNSEQFEEYTKFIHGLVDSIWPIEKFVDEHEEFILVNSTFNANMPYTDFLLALVLYHFRSQKCFIMTTDIADFKKDIFDRELVTYFNEDKIVNIALFSLNMSKYRKASENILKI